MAYAGSRETWLAQSGVTDGTAASYGYGDLTRDFEAKSPDAAKAIRDRVTLTPYLYTAIPDFQYSPEPVTPYLQGSYRISTHILGKDGVIAHAIDGQHPGKPITVGGQRAYLLGVSPEDPNYAVYVQDGRLHRILVPDPATILDPNLGDLPLGSMPATLPDGFAVDEITSENLGPLLDQLRDEVLAGLNDRGTSLGDLPDDARAGVRNWLGHVRSDMASSKLAGLRYGEQMRDLSLLNYTRRYGIDQVADAIVPYQFWSTRTMVNWALRMIEAPQLFALYARYREAQRRMAVSGMPARLEGNMRMPLPFLPSWMGGGVFFDPMKTLFPPDQFGYPLEALRNQAGQDEQQVNSILRGWGGDGTASQADVQNAILTKTGPLWERASAQVKNNTDAELSSPLDFIRLMFSPALYWSIPAAIASGKADQLPLLPITRTGQAIRASLRGTPLETIGNLAGGVLAGPETALRKGAGLSEYGQWGNYYIERMLSNMAGTGDITPEEANRAMIEKAGPAYDLARSRVETELSIRVPTVLPLFAATHGAPPLQIALAGLAGLFPGGLLPQGELIQRGLAAEYNDAWEHFKNGDDKAITTFFNEHPEYETRLALKNTPEEKLRNFLVSQIWDKYMALEGVQKGKIREAFGDPFVTGFLDKETQDYTSIPVNTLAGWAQALNGIVPSPVGAPLSPDKIDVKLYPPELAKGITAYQNERNKSFPNWYAMQTAYYASGDHKGFMARFPQLAAYWDWKHQYEADHPELAQWFDEQRAKYAGEPAAPKASGTSKKTYTNTGKARYYRKGSSGGGGGGGGGGGYTPAGRGHLTMTELRQFSKPLIRQLFSYFLGNIPLTDGALAELQRLYAVMQPGVDFKVWLDEWIKLSFTATTTA